MDNNINNIIKNKLDNYKPQAPKHVLESVKSNYPNQPRLNPKTIITAVSVIAILTASYFIIENLIQKEEMLNTVKVQQTDYYKKANHSIRDANTEEDLAVLEKSTNNNIQNEKAQKSESISKQKIKTNVFLVSDTVICGNKFDIPKAISTDKLIIPNHIKLSSDKNSSYLFASNEGTHQIIYQNKTDNFIYLDTIEITFYNINEYPIKVIRDINCPGEELLVICDSNADYKTTWELDGGVINKKGDNIFAISWNDPGTKNISLTTENKGCKTVSKASVRVPAEIEYEVISRSSFCNTQSGQIQIKSKNYNNVVFQLDNKINLTGEFSNLTAGLYNLEINYNNGCLIDREIRINDSLKISTMFTSEQDFNNEKKYAFTNKTKIDDVLYTSINNINFSWYIDNKKISNSDNAIFEFENDGKYTVKLEAYVSDNCVDSFEKTIEIEKTKFKTPNIFTPNDDGIGDVFYATTTKPVVNFHGVISSRTGEVVFEWRDINEGWNGKIRGSNDDASEGVYFYLLRAEDYNGKTIVKKGTLQLVR